MSKNTDSKDLDQSNDKSSGNDSKGALIKETQSHRANDDHAGSFESLGHSFNKLLATVTGQKIESVADKLSPKMAERLYHGKMLDQQLQTHKGMDLSVEDRQSLDDYKKFKDTISRQIPLFDHDALIETLNARIAERVSTNKPIVETTVANSKVPQPTEHKSKADVSTPTEKRHVPAVSQPEKAVLVSPAPQAGHIAKHSETKLSDAGRIGQERSSSPLTRVAGAPSTNVQGPIRPEESRLISSPHSDKRAISGREQQVEIHKKQPSHMENFLSASHFSKKGVDLTPFAQRELSKSHTISRSESQPITVDIQKLHVLSEKTLKTLNHREIFLQRSLNPQYEKSPEKFLAIHLLKSETVVTKKGVHTSAESLSKNTKFESGTVINLRTASLEPGITKGNLADPEKRESGSRSKAMSDAKLDTKIENHAVTPASLHTDKQLVASLKTPIEIPRPTGEISPKRIEHFSASDKPITLTRANARVELSSSLSLKVDAQRRLNLPVSNLLTRTAEVDRGKKNDAPSRFESRVIATAKRSPVSAQPDRRNTNNEKAPQPQTKEFVVVRAQIGQRRYILGTEIALAAVIAAAGIARVRHDRVIPQDLGNQPTPRTNPALESGQNAHRNDSQVLEVARNPRQTIKLETLARRIDEDIESFAVPSDLLREVKSNEKQFLQNVQRFFKQILDNKYARETITTQPLFRPAILVELDDTLQEIAERYFNDINVAWLIADLNRGNVREAYIDSKRIISMQSRQTLILPVWTDIVSFYQNDFADVEIERLVTIVETSQVDVELYSQMFANVIENKSTRNKTNHTAVSEAQTEA
jgi:hypothetical protein